MEQVEFTRECDVVQIPAGVTVRIEKGTEAFVSSPSVGRSRSRSPPTAASSALPGREADAIGKEAPATADAAGRG